MKPFLKPFLKPFSNYRVNRIILKLISGIIDLILFQESNCGLLVLYVKEEN